MQESLSVQLYGFLCVFIYPYNQHGKHGENLHPVNKFPCASSQSMPTPSPTPRKQLFFLLSLVFHVLGLHINGIMLLELFVLPPFNIFFEILSCCVQQQFTLFFHYCLLLQWINCHLLIHFPVDGECFQFWALRNKTVKKNLLQTTGGYIVFPWVSNLEQNCQAIEKAHAYILWKVLNSFLKWLHHF